MSSNISATIIVLEWSRAETDVGPRLLRVIMGVAQIGKFSHCS